MELIEEVRQLKFYMVASEHWRIEWLVQRIEDLCREVDYLERDNFRLRNTREDI